MFMSVPEQNGGSWIISCSDGEVVLENANQLWTAILGTILGADVLPEPYYLENRVQG